MFIRKLNGKENRRWIMKLRYFFYYFNWTCIRKEKETLKMHLCTCEYSLWYTVHWYDDRDNWLDSDIFSSFWPFGLKDNFENCFSIKVVHFMCIHWKSFNHAASPSVYSQFILLCHTETHWKLEIKKRIKWNEKNTENKCDENERNYWLRKCSQSLLLHVDFFV